MAVAPIYKHPLEVRVRGLDYSDVLAKAYQPSGPVTIKEGDVETGWINTPDGITVEHVGFLGNIAVFKLSGGTDGMEYALSHRVVLSNNIDKPVTTVIVKVNDGAPAVADPIIV